MVADGEVYVEFLLENFLSIHHFYHLYYTFFNYFTFFSTFSYFQSFQNSLDYLLSLLHIFPSTNLSRIRRLRFSSQID